MIKSLKNNLKHFWKLHFPEKIWIIIHIFKAKKVWEITQKALHISNEYKNDPDLDGDYSGGMVDAFRHTLWMAMLTRRFGERLARSLGRVHEKGNKIDFKKKILEEDKLPDAVSCEMDLKNNEVGIAIGKANPNCSDQILIQIVKRAVINGWCWKIKKDKNGNYLDAFDNIIPEEQWKGKWITPKILVPSDFSVNNNRKI